MNEAMWTSAAFARIGFAAVSATAGIAALIPRLSPPGLLHIDKLVHIAVFAALSGLGSIAHRSRFGRALAAGGLVILAIGIEIAQSSIHGRTGSYFDALASIIGISSGAVLVQLMR